jgi:hypothetical protein
MIAADQLRGELPERYLAKMCSGGFRSSLENDVVYKYDLRVFCINITKLAHAAQMKNAGQATGS